MIENKEPVKQNGTPEDVAALYSWANLQGAKYRDFSASRAENREKIRQRAQQVIEEQRQSVDPQDVAGQETVQEHTAEAVCQTGLTQPESAGPEQIKSEQIKSRAAESEPTKSILIGSEPVEIKPTEPKPVEESVVAAAKVAVSELTAAELDAQTAVRQSEALPYLAHQSAQGCESSIPTSSAPIRNEVPKRGAPVSVEGFNPSGNRWEAVEAVGPESAARPAWLEAAEASRWPVSSSSSKVDTAPLESRNRLDHNWFTFKNAFERERGAAKEVTSSIALHAPLLAVFSLAGGVGKTSLLATLGRTFAALGERVLLVDTTAFGMLPFFFGGSEQCPGQLRTYVSPRASGYQDLRGDAPVQMITIDPESLAPDAAGSDAVRAETASLAGEIARYARGAERIFVDLPTASGATLRRVMPLAPTILVPMIPDVASVVSVDSIDAFCARYSPRSQRVLPYYVLNQFDDSLALHLDVREMLSQRLGSRLLPFVLNRAPLVSEALAEGMTVIDYAPHSAVAEEFGNLAGWVRSFTAARATESGNVRWSER